MPAAIQQEKGTLEHSLRREALCAAKRHKASWIELGRYLGTIFRDKCFREWGFLAFETYCVKELGIKRETASKLMKSYSFLETEEPRILEARTSEEAPPKGIPNYEAVNLLRLARENRKLTPGDYAHIRGEVLESGREVREIRSEMRKMLAEREEESNPSEARRRDRNSKIKRLASLLSSAKREFEGAKLLPGFLLREMAALAEKLEAQLE